MNPFGLFIIGGGMAAVWYMLRPRTKKADPVYSKLTPEQRVVYADKQRDAAARREEQRLAAGRARAGG